MDLASPAVSGTSVYANGLTKTRSPKIHVKELFRSVLPISERPPLFLQGSQAHPVCPSSKSTTLMKMII